jgi:molecular chaperone DnaK
MVRDAEAHAAEDHRMRELVDARNNGDALVHSTKKTLTEYGDKLEAGEKEKIEAAIKELEGALRGSDKVEIDARVHALATASQKFGEKLYAGVQSQAASGSEGSASQEADGGTREEDVVDAEFKEVKTKR